VCLCVVYVSVCGVSVCVRESLSMELGCVCVFVFV